MKNISEENKYEFYHDVILKFVSVFVSIFVQLFSGKNFTIWDLELQLKLLKSIEYILHMNTVCSGITE